MTPEERARLRREYEANIGLVSMTPAQRAEEMAKWDRAMDRRDERLDELTRFLREPDVEPLLAHLRAERDRARSDEDHELGMAPRHRDPNRVNWFRGRSNALEEALVSIARWARGENPDPSVPG